MDFKRDVQQSIRVRVGRKEPIVPNVPGESSFTRLCMKSISYRIPHVVSPASQAERRSLN